MHATLNYFVFSRKTAFMPLRDLYGECFPLIQEYDQVIPMQCYYTECPANVGCAEVTAHRVHYLFDKVFTPDVGLLIAYFKYRDRPQSIRGVLFFRDMREPKVMILNRSGFEKCYKEGFAYSWQPPAEYSRLGYTDRSQIISLDNLTKKVHGHS